MCNASYEDHVWNYSYSKIQLGMKNVRIPSKNYNIQFGAREILLRYLLLRYSKEFDNCTVEKACGYLFLCIMYITKKAMWRTVKRSIQQGTIFGPLLFLLSFQRRAIFFITNVTNIRICSIFDQRRIKDIDQKMFKRTGGTK